MDKIEKIRAEIARLKGQLIRGACAAQIEMETNCKDEAYNEVLAFLDTLEEEPINYDTKRKIEDHINELNDKYLGGVYSSYDMAKAYVEGNIDGQKLQKEQMMKEAVEGVVEDWNPEPHPEITIPLNPEEFTVGDKVKLIVIKED